LRAQGEAHTRPKQNILDREITVGSFLWLNGLRRSKIKFAPQHSVRGRVKIYLDDSKQSLGLINKPPSFMQPLLVWQNKWMIEIHSVRIRAVDPELKFQAPAPGI